MYSGDSGGPLVVPKSSRDNSAIVIGLTSFGYKKGCGYERMPDVFTKVIKYLDWIKDRMEHNSAPSGTYRVSGTYNLGISDPVLVASDSLLNSKDITFLFQTNQYTHCNFTKMNLKRIGTF